MEKKQDLNINSDNNDIIMVKKSVFVWQVILWFLGILALLIGILPIFQKVVLTNKYIASLVVGIILIVLSVNLRKIVRSTRRSKR